MALTLEDLYQQWLDSFSKIFLENGSNYEAYINALLSSIKDYSDRVDEFGDSLSILQANSETLLLWERFLELSQDAFFSDDYRRRRIIVHTAGYPPTISNIISVIKTLTNSSTVSILEHGNPEDVAYNPSTPFAVTVNIILTIDEIIENFDPNSAEITIRELFPAHTNVTFNWTLPVEYQIYYSPVTPPDNPGNYDSGQSIYA